MRNLNLLSAVGVAVVAAWLAVTTLAYADEFTCTIPWYKSTTCDLPKFSIPPGGKLTVELYTVKIRGRDFTQRCPFFQVFDVNNNNIELTKPMEVCAKAAAIYENPLKTKEQIVYLRFTISQGNDVDITGKYTVTK
jgi:hypothetical protein